MNRTILLLIAFLLLGGLTTWYLVDGDDEKTTLAGADRRFAVKDLKGVQRIFLADRQGEKVNLVRNGDHWLYNDKYQANPSAMRNLLEAVGQVQIKYKPPVAAVETMVKSLATEGIKVEVYGADDELIRAYYVGGATPDERGTYMMIAEAEQPYVCYLPAWEGNLRFRYSLKGNEWRDRTIFAFQPEAIQSVAVEYPKQRNKSFRLEYDAGDYTVTPFYEVTPAANRPLQAGKVEAFLAGFERIGAEAFQNGLEGRDSIAALVPFSIITVTTREGERTEVRLHPITPEGYVDASGNLRPESLVVERYYADVPTSGDFYLTQHRVLQRVLWAYDFFFQP